jgi:hypothetical protein
VPPRPADVRFYFDEDVLGLAKVVATLRPDVTYPGDPGGTVHRRLRPPCPIPLGSKDPEWIPFVASRGWVIVTRDAAIQRRPAEVAAVRENDARMVVIAGSEARGTWEQLEVLMVNWRRLERWAEEPGPFIYAITRTGTPRSVLLES